MQGLDLSIVILTKDEALNLPHLLESVRPLGAKLYVCDSGSEDGTVAIARNAGCFVATNPFRNYATQFNWALDNMPIDTTWVMRMDADERFTPELVAEVKEKLGTFPSDVTALFVKRQVWFWGRWIRHGGMYPTWLLRFWRRGLARCEARWMDEHMEVSEGRSSNLTYDIIDENKKDLTFWTDKHNKYANREVIDLIETAENADHLEGQAKRRRVAKQKFYNKFPLFLRSFIYFIFRYFILLGFLDGKPGLVFHVLQGFWYRFLVDAKLYEKKRAQENRAT